MGLSPLLGGIAALLAVDDPKDWAAFEMARTAILALLTRSAEQRSAVADWDAHRHGCTGAGSDVRAFIEIATAVERAAHFYATRYYYACQGKNGAVAKRALTETGRAVVKRLHVFFVRQFGPTIPGVEDLEDWIARHAKEGARGKLTTAGIVAKIVHRGRLLGARGEDEAKTLRRVTMALSRRKGTRAS
jgi:hypothetical protein